VIDLVGWRALRWDEATLGREIVAGDVPEELREEALHARHELLEVLADEVDSFTEAFLERENEVSQAEVPTYRWAWWSRTVPAPTAAAVVSPVPVTTWTCGPSPSSRAAPGRIGPTSDAGDRSSGSVAGSNPDRTTRSSSQRTRCGSRLSLHHRSTAVS